MFLICSGSSDKVHRVMEKNIKFDLEKFKDVVHLVIHYVSNTHGRDALGNTKLHKSLYYSDFLNYLRTMKPLTGEDFLRQRFGPTSRHLKLALEILAQEGRVSTSTSDYFGYKKRDYVSILPPQSNRLAEHEVRLVESMADFVCVHTATEISEFSHDDVWSSVSMGDRIPYFASFGLFPVEITDEDRKATIADIERIAPHVEAEKRERGLA